MDPIFAPPSKKNICYSPCIIIACVIISIVFMLSMFRYRSTKKINSHKSNRWYTHGTLNHPSTIISNAYNGYPDNNIDGNKDNFRGYFGYRTRRGPHFRGGRRQKYFSSFGRFGHGRDYYPIPYPHYIYTDKYPYLTPFYST